MNLLNKVQPTLTKKKIVKTCIFKVNDLRYKFTSVFSLDLKTRLCMLIILSI